MHSKNLSSPNGNGSANLHMQGGVTLRIMNFKNETAKNKRSTGYLSGIVIPKPADGVF